MFRFRRRRTDPGAATADSTGVDSARPEDTADADPAEEIPDHAPDRLDPALDAAEQPSAGMPYATDALPPGGLGEGHHGLLSDPPPEEPVEADGEASGIGVGLNVGEASETGVGQGQVQRGEPNETEYLAPPAATEDPDATGRPHMSAKNLRRTLILVAVGSLAAAAITLVSTGNLDNIFGSSTENSASSGSDNAARGSTRSTGTAEGPAFSGSEPGTCLTWEDSGDPTIESVDCAEPHYFEVATRIDLAQFPASEFGPHAQLASPARYATIRDTLCQPAATRYLNGRLDPSGKFTVGVVHPGKHGWTGGERTVLCGLQQTGVDGTEFQPITGKVADQDQSPVHTAGTCLGIADGLPGNPVDCTEPHAVEVTGQVDLAQKFPDGWPAIEDQDEFLGATCEKISEDYVGGYDALHNTTLTSYWDTVSLPSWLAGSHRVDCLLGFGDGHGTYTPLTGNAADGLLIDGNPPDPAPMPPPGRSVHAPVPLGDSGVD